MLHCVLFCRDLGSIGTSSPTAVCSSRFSYVYSRTTLLSSLSPGSRAANGCILAVWSFRVQQHQPSVFIATSWRAVLAACADCFILKAVLVTRCQERFKGRKPKEWQPSHGEVGRTEASDRYEQVEFANASLSIQAVWLKLNLPLERPVQRQIHLVKRMSDC
eukprot:6173772-Pleurochrysis_carterae.AAC.1